MPGSLTISPAFGRPKKAMKSPMPAAMTRFMLGLIEFMTASRGPTSESTRNSTPETNTAPSAAARQVAVVTATISVLKQPEQAREHRSRPRANRSGIADVAQFWIGADTGRVPRTTG